MRQLRRHADLGPDGVIIEANDMLSDLMTKYPHDAAIAAVFAAIRARCSTAEAFIEVAEFAAETFGPGYRDLTAKNQLLS